jgi:predicted HTH transcriptional regulator
MNTNGGELLLGVSDTGQVMGIEADLRSRNHDPADFDWYQREIGEMLRTHIDELVYRQVRITFTEHSEGTVCHIAVAPSPTPRFGRPLTRSNEQPHPTFWVRAGNTTRAIAGNDMVTYIHEQWR